VMNTHRNVIYQERTKILEGADLKANILDMVRQEIAALVDAHVPDRAETEWDVETLHDEVNTIVHLPPELSPKRLAEMDHDAVMEALLSYAEQAYEERERAIGAETMRMLERLVMLRTIDTLWVEHLTAMEEMREGIGLQAYGQADPLVAYKREAHDMWDQLLENIRRQITRQIYHVELAPRAETDGGRPAAVGARGPRNIRENREAASVAAAATKGKIGRNDPCPCGSGRKYKKCHGQAA